MDGRYTYWAHRSDVALLNAQLFLNRKEDFGEDNRLNDTSSFTRAKEAVSPFYYHRLHFFGFQTDLPSDAALVGSQNVDLWTCPL